MHLYVDIILSMTYDTYSCALTVSLHLRHASGTFLTFPWVLVTNVSLISYPQTLS